MSSFLYGLMIFLLTFLFMLYVVMYPAIHSRSSGEMQAAYYILVVPDALKILSSYSFFGLLIVIPLYFRARLHKPATLRFEGDRLTITGKKIEIAIPIERIDKVFCNDVKNAFGEPKGKLQVVIRQKNRTLTTFRLNDYEQGGELIDAVGALQGVSLAGYDKEMATEHDDE
ncbi:MAG: hypothetical protein EOO06_20735 [Chitinophagaceae bacterium]|nr:MAG: hypothetical protein EOO06_20735 [Chitinophagaceae bacterium]